MGSSEVLDKRTLRQTKANNSLQMALPAFLNCIGEATNSKEEPRSRGRKYLTKHPNVHHRYAYQEEENNPSNKPSRIASGCTLENPVINKTILRI